MSSYRAAFRRGLEKLALSPGFMAGLGRRALTSGGTASLGAAGGAALGTVAGGVHGFQQDRSQGGSGIRGALGGAVSGAAGGAALGGIAGAGIGAAGGQKMQQAVMGLARPGASKPGHLGQIVRFGQRQAHSLTGAVPEGFASQSAALESIGGGVAPLRRQMADLASRAAQATGPEKAKLTARLGTMQQGLAAGEKTVDMGMTSVPGLFKAMATRPGEALRTTAEYQWKSNPTLGSKAFAFGLPGAAVVGEIAAKRQEGGDSRGVRAVSSLASTIPYSLAPMPMAGASAVAGILGGGAALVRRAVRGRKPELGAQPSPPVPEDGGVSSPVEHQFSDRAMGRMPEGQT